MLSQNQAFSTLPKQRHNIKPDFFIAIRNVQAINYSRGILTFKDFWLCVNENVQPQSNKEVLDQLAYLAKKVEISSNPMKKVLQNQMEMVSNCI